MAGTTSASEGAAGAARQLAREILAEGRFHKASVPRPLHSVLREIGRFLESPLNALEELVHKLGSDIPGGSAVVWGVLALVVTVVGVAVSLRGTRRVLSAPAVSPGSQTEVTPLSAEELERQAATAERAGLYAEAVRYRFRAGLLRLAERDIVSHAPAALNIEVVRALSSPAFEQLAARFDEITYGGSAAHQDDAQRSRDVWAVVLKGGPAS
jgi:hypothetical protein